MTWFTCEYSPLSLQLNGWINLSLLFDILMVHVFRTTIPLHTFYYSSHAHIEGAILHATSVDDLADAKYYDTV